MRFLVRLGIVNIVASFLSLQCWAQAPSLASARVRVPLGKEGLKFCGTNMHCIDMFTLNADYCCQATEKREFVNMAGGFWPQECAILHDYLLDFDFMSRIPRRDHIKQMPYLCASWQMLRKPGFSHITPTALQRPQMTMFNYYYDHVEALLPIMPHRTMYWPQFLTISILRGVCDAYNGKKRCVRISILPSLSALR